MIEITHAPDEGREKLRKIPKNIRQIGNTSGYGKIYMEDAVYRFLAEGGFEEGQSLSTYLLLGEDFYQKEEQYIFIKSAFELEQISYNREFPVFSEEVWNTIYSTMRRYFQDQKILGWALNRKGGRLDFCSDMETICRRHFHGENQMVLFFDTVDDDEMIYLYHNGRYLKKDGYHIYYEKNTGLAEYLVDYHQRKSAFAQKRRREALLEQERFSERERLVKEGARAGGAAGEMRPDAEDGDNRVRSARGGNSKLRSQAGMELEKKFYENPEEDVPFSRRERDRRRSQEQAFERERLQRRGQWQAGGQRQSRDARQSGEARQGRDVRQSGEWVRPGGSAGWETDTVSRYRDLLQEKRKRPYQARKRALAAVSALVLMVLAAAVIQNYTQLRDMEDAVDAIAQQQAQEDVLETISKKAGELTEEGDASEGGDDGSAAADGQAAENSGTDGSQDAAGAGADAGTQPTGGAQTDAAAQTGASAQIDASAQTDASTQTTAETNQYLAQGYYVVQEGDKLLDISRKVYGNDQMVAAICEANGITNINHIQVGDRLTLPNP